MPPQSGKKRTVRRDPEPPHTTETPGDDVDMSDPEPHQEAASVGGNAHDDTVVQDIAVDVQTLCDAVDDLNSAVLTFDGSPESHRQLEERIQVVKNDLMSIIESHSKLGRLLVQARDALTAIVSVAKAKVDAQKMLAEKRINLRK